MRTEHTKYAKIYTIRKFPTVWYLYTVLILQLSVDYNDISLILVHTTIISRSQLSN